MFLVWKYQCRALKPKSIRTRKFGSSDVLDPVSQLSQEEKTQIFYFSAKLENMKDHFYCLKNLSIRLQQPKLVQTGIHWRLLVSCDVLQEENPENFEFFLLQIEKYWEWWWKPSWKYWYQASENKTPPNKHFSGGPGVLWCSETSFRRRKPRKGKRIPAADIGADVALWSETCLAVISSPLTVCCRGSRPLWDQLAANNKDRLSAAICSFPQRGLRVKRVPL